MRAEFHCAFVLVFRIWIDGHLGGVFQAILEMVVVSLLGCKRMHAGVTHIRSTAMFAPVRNETRHAGNVYVMKFVFFPLQKKQIYVFFAIFLGREVLDEDFFVFDVVVQNVHAYERVLLFETWDVSSFHGKT